MTHAPLQPTPPAIHVFPDGRMDANSAAAYTGLTVKSLAIMRSLGTGPAFFKLGKKCFYQREDLDAWIQTRRAVSTADFRAARAARKAAQTQQEAA